MQAKGGLWIIEPWAMGSVNLGLGGTNPDLNGVRRIDAVQFDVTGPSRIYSAHDATDTSDEAVTGRLKEIQRLWRSASAISIVEAKPSLQGNEGWTVIGQAVTSEFAMRFSYGDTAATVTSVIVVGSVNSAMQRQATESGLIVEIGKRCNCLSNDSVGK